MSVIFKYLLNLTDNTVKLTDNIKVNKTEQFSYVVGIRNVLFASRISLKLTRLICWHVVVELK